MRWMMTRISVIIWGRMEGDSHRRFFCVEGKPTVLAGENMIFIFYNFGVKTKHWSPSKPYISLTWTLSKACKLRVG
jgi:hypothetical protein